MEGGRKCRRQGGGRRQEAGLERALDVHGTLTLTASLVGLVGAYVGREEEVFSFLLQISAL